VSGDGHLDEAEVLKALAKKLGYMASGVVARQMLSIADQDQNGKVSRAELTGILLAGVEDRKRLAAA